MAIPTGSQSDILRSRQQSITLSTSHALYTYTLRWTPSLYTYMPNTTLNL